MGAGIADRLELRGPLVRRLERASDHGEYSAFARRAVRAMGRRVADSDPDDLVLMLALRAELDDAITAAVVGQRQAGFTWSQIADVLGVSRQAAQQRWGDAVPPDLSGIEVLDDPEDPAADVSGPARRVLGVVSDHQVELPAL